MTECNVHVHVHVGPLALTLGPLSRVLELAL